MGERNPSQWVTYQGSDAQIDRMWRHIAAAEPRHTLSARWLFATAVVVAGIIAWSSNRAVPSTLDVEGAQFASAELGRTTLLADGSRVELAAESSVKLAMQRHDQMQLELKGTATFEVAKRPTRQFAVHAQGVVVRVIGTRFTVRESIENVEVVVHRGSVEIDHDGVTERLVAGDSWRSLARTASARQPALDPELTIPEPVAASPIRRPVRTVKPAKQKVVASRAAAPAPIATAAVPPSDVLFSAALTARREGRLSDAASHLQDFVVRFRSDGRAPVAALELARIQMDHLRDGRRAVASLQLSLLLGPEAAFREEAMSRLVRGHDELGNHHACLEARDAYLHSYPAGAYAMSVRTRCKP